MKIATNTPSSFYPQSGYEFVQLGEGLADASMIVLLLEKNWGAASIDKIKALTKWISDYSKNIPCYIVGCETNIPDKAVWRFRHEERDDAIRALCDEVLKRSTSIGVRGEITHLHLTEMLGYKKDLVDVIYVSSANDNSERLRHFLEKNNCLLGSFEKSLLEFQAKPSVFYERPITFEKEIIIPHAYITDSEFTSRLNADVRIDGKLQTLWCEVSKLYRQFLLSERADAFLCALLPFAMRSGKDIICEAPVTEQFLHNLNEILIPQLCTHDRRLHRTRIIATGESSALPCGNAVATGMSCGVDSFYTVSLYKSSEFESMNLTQLYCGNYLYGNDGAVYDRAELAAKDLALPLVRTTTNINETLRLPHLFTHFYKLMFGVLALRKLFRIYYYSSAEDYSHFNIKDNSIRACAEVELLLLYVFSCSDFQIVSGGVKSERLEKVRALGALATARKLLNVCLYPEQKINCGKCGKCIRTLLMLDMVGSLDLFQDVFDIEEYRRTRLDSFVYLIEQRNSIMLSQVYRYFLKTDPLLVKNAEKIYLRRTKELNYARN
ncbi:MAG: hypothetical protein HC900_06345 [Methylacidiphilales bacterium]|nr:hypothetical protein [Candidatus Methylacidiphilales bacterium]